jgi:hypothetical protein
MRISHEAILQTLYIQGRGALRRELVGCLRAGRALRVPRARARAKAWAHISEEVMISNRPAKVEDRAVPGHWEGHLLIDPESIGHRDAGGKIKPFHDARAFTSIERLRVDTSHEEWACDASRLRGHHDGQRT